MKILRLTAENILKLKAVEITPDGNTVIISGKNAAGKSSVLNAIWLALGGGEASRAIEHPLRLGEAEGEVELDLGDIIVRREYSGDRSRLIVENKAGARFGSPQGMLDELIGRLAFDPVAFSQLDGKKQVEALRQVTGLDFTGLDRERQEVYNDRTMVNRALKEVEAQLQGITPRWSDGPKVRRDADELKKMLAAAQAQVALIQDKVRKQTSIEQEMQVLDLRIGNAQAEMASLQARVAELLSERNNKKELHTNLGFELIEMDEPDVDSIVSQLAEIGEYNQQVAEQEQYARLRDRRDDYATQAVQLGKRIDAIDSEKERLLAETHMPLEGLSFESDELYYQGVPFKQASSAEQLRVSLAMAMALNPKLRVIRVLDASLLDSQNMAVIQEMAEEHDYQVWLEVVADQPGLGIYIEDGQVVGTPPKEVKSRGKRTQRGPAATLA